MADLLERLRYTIQDILGKKSYAETQMQKYQQVVEGIQEKLKQMEDLEEVIAQIGIDYDYLELNSFSASGKLSSTYEEKESQNRAAVESIEQHYNIGVSYVKSKYQEAQNQYEYWKGEAEREDREMKVYEKQYYEQLELQKRQEEARRRERENERQNRGRGRLR